MRPRVGTALAVALLVALAGCGSDPAPGGSPATPDPTSSAPLAWQTTDGSPDDRRIVGAQWTALVSDDGSQVAFDGPQQVVIEAGAGRVIGEVLMDDDWAVVVGRDEQETRSSTVTVVDLATGRTHGVTDPPPGSGGSWAMHEGRLRYAAYDVDGDYCLAEVSLAEGSGDFVYCAPDRHGFSRLSMGPAGDALMTFDDDRPVACRTLELMDQDGATEPVAGVEECAGWDVAATTRGAIWSTVTDERRSEQGRFHASVDGEVRDLGAGTTGTLTTCGDSAYFVRDPQRPGQPARLLRWDGDSLEVVYQSRGSGPAFLAPPSCSGNVLTVSAFAEGGDEQVWAEAP